MSQNLPEPRLVELRSATKFFAIVCVGPGFFGHDGGAWIGARGLAVESPHRNHHQRESSFMSNDEERPRATFTAFDEGTQSDWAILGAEFVRFAGGLPDRVLAHLALLAHGYSGFPVDRLTHSLQAATLAYDDGRDEEYIVCALLHDIGDSLGAYNHPDIAAAILRPFVSEANLWMVEKHGLFQSYHMLRDVLDYDVRDSLRSHRYYAHAEEFSARYDNRAFDPRRHTRSLAFFEPMVHRLFARPRPRDR